MEKEKLENLVEKMRDIRDQREKEIFETNQKDNKEISVEQIQYVGKMEFMQEIDGQKKMVEKDVFMLTEKKDGVDYLKYYDEDMNLLGVEIPSRGKEIIPSSKTLEQGKEIEQLGTKKKEGKSLEELEKGNKENEENKKDIISEDLSQDGEDLEITYYRKIVDSTFMQEFPETCQGAQEIGMAYSKTLNSYILVAKYNDKFEIAKGTEPAKATMRQVDSIDREKGQVTRQSPHALMSIQGNGNKNGTKELSVTIGQYGYIETQVVSVTRENERIGEDIAEQGESIRKQEKTYAEKEQEKAWGTEAVENKQDLIENENNPEIERMKEQIINNILEKYGEELDSLYNHNQENAISSINRRIQKAVSKGKLTQEDIQKYVEQELEEDIEGDRGERTIPRFE